MRIVSLLPILLWSTILLGGNYYLFLSTESKIKKYNINPPFRIEDATLAFGLAHLLDGDENTIWEKKTGNHLGWDFSLEMKLTHFWDGKAFLPRDFKSIEWLACPGKSLPKFEAKILLRESINVDKELRFPSSAGIHKFHFKKVGKSKTSLSMLPFKTIMNLKKQSHFPEEISIFTIEMKLPEAQSTNDCFSEIRLTE